MSNHEEHCSKGLPNGNHHQQISLVPKSSYTTFSDSFRPPYPFWWEEEISSSSSSNGSFVEYIPQYQDQEGGVESQTVVDFLNRECCRLLDLNPRDFWKQVASDTSLHVFLETFLKFRKRWYDFPYHGVRGTAAEVIVGDHELSRRVFMILYRISSNQDPGAKDNFDSLSAKDYQVILQKKNLLGMANLLDICAIYGYENEELTQLLVTNAIKAQPKIHYRFTSVTSLFLYIVDSMYERCGTSLEVLFSSHEAQDGFTRIHTYYLEVMDYLNDAIVSMDAFVNAHKYAAVYFCCPVRESDGGREEVLKKLARLHDSLLPSLQQGFKKIFSAKKADGSEFTSEDNILTSLNMLSSRIVVFCWNLLNLCYLSEDLCEDTNPLPPALKTFPANVKDPIIKGKNFSQRLIEISVESSRTAKERGSVNSLLQSVDKKYQLIGKLEDLDRAGWMIINDKQLQLLSDIIWVPRKYLNRPSASVNVEEIDEEDNGVMTSKILQVKDLFPGYGNGFISACLRVYNHSPEEVIQRILEGTLRDDLLSLYTWVPPKYVSNKDKGNGIIVELPNVVPKPQLEESTTKVPDPQIQDETAKNFDLQVDSFDNLRLSDDKLNEKVTLVYGQPQLRMLHKRKSGGEGVPP